MPHQTIPEPVRNTPVYDEVDVLVCGGGPAGFSAAVAAARAGARTLLIEQTNCLGGIATAGGHNHICLFSEWGTSVRVVGGVAWEMATRVESMGYGKITGGNVDFELEGMKLALERAAAEAPRAISGLLLTGGFRPEGKIMELLAGSHLPARLCRADTYTMAGTLRGLVFKITPDDRERIEAAKSLVERYVHVDRLIEMLKD